MKNPLFDCLTIKAEPYSVRLPKPHRGPKKFKKKKKRRRRKHVKPLALKAADYQSYITSMSWILRRKSYFKRHENKCAVCGEKRQIHLHHMTYKRLGYELDEDLVPLCDYHHSEYHKMYKYPSVKSTRSWIAAAREEEATSWFFKSLK